MVSKGTTARTSHVVPARELVSFDLGSERVDIRGWPVFAVDSRRVGVVERLMIEQSTKRVRYISVAVSPNAADDIALAADGCVLVPIGIVRRFDRQHAVVLEGLSSAQIAAAPRLHARPVTRADEEEALAAYGMATSDADTGSTLYDDPIFDEGRLRLNRSAQS